MSTSDIKIHLFFSFQQSPLNSAPLKSFVSEERQPRKQSTLLEFQDFATTLKWRFGEEGDYSIANLKNHQMYSSTPILTSAKWREDMYENSLLVLSSLRPLNLPFRCNMSSISSFYASRHQPQFPSRNREFLLNH